MPRYVEISSSQCEEMKRQFDEWGIELPDEYRPKGSKLRLRVFGFYAHGVLYSSFWQYARGTQRTR